MHSNILLAQLHVCDNKVLTHFLHSSNKQNSSKALCKRLTNLARMEVLEARRAELAAIDAEHAEEEEEVEKSYAGHYVAMDRIDNHMPRPEHIRG